MKTCEDCKQSKSPSEFYRCSAYPSGLDMYCKSCKKARNRDYYRRNHEKALNDARAWRALNPDYGKKYHWRNRDVRLKAGKDRYKLVKGLVLQRYGGKCACCGEREVAFLALDHIFNDGSAHRLKTKQTSMWRLVWKDGCPKSFQILCMNCNWGKYANGGTCPHQVKNVASVQ